MNKNNKDPKKNNNNKFNSYLIPGLIAITFLLWIFMSGKSEPIETDWSIVRAEYLLKHEVKNMTIVTSNQGLFVEVTIKEQYLDDEKHSKIKNRGGLNGSYITGPHYKFVINDKDRFFDQLDEAQLELPNSERIEPGAEIRKDIFGEVLGFIIPIAILFIIWLFIFRRMSNVTGGGGGPGGIFNVGKSKAKIFDKDTSVKVDFKDVAGLEEAKVEIQEIVEFLKKPKKYTELGGKIPKGALLVGPPGTGKTLLAKAVAGEANVPFFSMSGSDFVEMFVGVGASRVRDLFKQAKEKAPCIVFIDEIDAIGRARGKNPNMGANDERENTLNQLLTEMDGFATNTGVIILAATNRADILDRALLRAGRFDRQIHVELPDLNERREIFKVHMKPLKYAKEVDVEFLSKQTPGFSGADIANVCNESALIAARKEKKKIERQDFLDAVDRIVGGLERKTKIITPHEKRTIAFHEAGHATVSWMLEYANPLVKVTIIPRGKALGAAWYLPEERQITTKDQLLDELCSTLGGRASEDINFGKYSTGALNDLERVTKQAYAMVQYYGLSDKLGHKSYYDSSGQSEYSFSKPFSEKTAEVIDEEADKIIQEQYKRAVKILNDNKESLIKLGERLLEKEVIFNEDLEEIFGPRKFSHPTAGEEIKEKAIEENGSDKSTAEKEMKEEGEEVKSDSAESK
ncbi:MAG: ATP-dependent zinc metalloprotease FtsH [Bacteroidales bacterium]|nr:ATP-dependent zinc metalloprotease FtsH [Bacteroidales bacterium]MBN2818217.1 ATP-dependent zinc metalloprotease FtsH [Bacteroidales bacterium]